MCASDELRGIDIKSTGKVLVNTGCSREDTADSEACATTNMDSSFYSSKVSASTECLCTVSGKDTTAR